MLPSLAALLLRLWFMTDPLQVVPVAGFTCCAMRYMFDNCWPLLELEVTMDRMPPPRAACSVARVLPDADVVDSVGQLSSPCTVVTDLQA